MRERRRVIVQVKNRGRTVPLTSADIAEILASLHCRQTRRSQLVMEKLTRGLQVTLGSAHAAPDCLEASSGATSGTR